MPRLNHMVLLMLVIAGTVGSSGCRSSSSTMFSRNESNTGWCEFDKADGFPITIRVPTHVKLYVYETHYLEQDDLGNNIKKTRYVDLPVTIRDFAHEMIYSEKIVMVDFKRPAAGAFNLEVDLTEDQYIEKIQHDVTDDTLAQVNAILGTLNTAGGIFNPAAADPVESTSLTEVKSVVAVGMFEVDAPDFELQVNEFLNCHINKAHDAWRASPGVESVNRILPQERADLQLCPSGNCPTFSTGQFAPGWATETIHQVPEVPQPLFAGELPPQQ